jgi:hypothetical protein
MKEYVIARVAILNQKSATKILKPYFQNRLIEQAVITNDAVRKLL